MKNPRVRFAPSPTGYLHVGGARTALFNWLYAKKYNGTFVLRIEDTDIQRSSDEMVNAITESMEWLGLNWDEGPHFQSQNISAYQEFAQNLITQKKAYYCYCTPERLKNLQTDGNSWKYDRHCLHLSKEEIDKLEYENAPKIVRFLVPEGKTEFIDGVHGTISVDNSQIEDFVLLRSDNHPTYHLAVVVDDSKMKINHIIRGDDHISNTPKQILLYQAGGLEMPQFSHLPLILGADKKRLSKRHGATAVGQFKEKGILPQALFNYLALLGWSPGNNREIMNINELIQAFSISNVNTGNAVFDEQKLEWMNGQYIANTDSNQLYKFILPDIIQQNLITNEKADSKKDWLLKMIELQKPRMKYLSDFPDLSIFFFREITDYETKSVKKYWSKDWSLSVMKNLLELLESIDDFTEQTLEEKMRGLAEKMEMGAGKVIHPTRLAITGRGNSPGLFETMELLGKNTVCTRMKNAIKFIKNDLQTYATE